jgi:SprT protein
MEAISIFKRYFPEPTVDYCHQLWQTHRFKFVVSPKRQTKLGDYRFNAQDGHHIVTVNGNLNPYSFLTTYIHEVAHLTAFKKYGYRVMPHGKEWKHEFRELYKPLLVETHLPKDVIQKLHVFLRNPKAASCSEQGLFVAEGNILLPNQRFLKDLPTGTKFYLKRKSYLKLELRRTRVLCEDCLSHRKYLIHQDAIVEVGL